MLSLPSFSSGKSDNNLSRGFESDRAEEKNMKTVALISGGKDSCFNMMQCANEGHQLVALANLRPKDKDELDSYMYQTVGHQAIDLYAEAMGLPLYRHTIQRTALSTGRDYVPLEGDEVEDLYELLSKVKADMEVEAVAVGAILSDYQRVRVESVCLRLGLTPLAYLWRREQAALLREMVECGMEAILVKVAAMGLDPEHHLGLSLQQILPHMLKMQEQYGLNVCGEGGEYETFTLDCPLFHKKIIVDEKETVVHSADAFAPVGYIRFKRLHLEAKGHDCLTQDQIITLPMTSSCSLMKALRLKVQHCDLDISSIPALSLPSVEPFTGTVCPCRTENGNYFSVGGVVAVRQPSVEGTCHKTMEQLKGTVEAMGRKMMEVFSVSLFISKMSDFTTINSVYKTSFGINPPVRICVGACLPENVLFILDCQGWRAGDNCPSDRRTMHVQGISHWAPANIGPYSQATMVDGRVFIAGQIPLVPGTMQLVSGGIATQCRLALQHTHSVLTAICPCRNLPDVLLCICYVTHPDIIPVARQQWEELNTTVEVEEVVTQKATHRPLIEYVVVPCLPRGASVEWQVYAACDDISCQDYADSLIKGNFQVCMSGLQSEDTLSIFAVSLHVYFEGEICRSLDAKAAVAACLGGYSRFLHKLRRCWSDVPLLRIFYPAHLCSYQVLLEAWMQALESQADYTIIMSLVPVVQLENEKLVMIVCH